LIVPEDTLPQLWARIQNELEVKRRALTEEEIRDCANATRS
jgi:hypothetical protein